jgi:hypothetical protein
MKLPDPGGVETLLLKVARARSRSQAPAWERPSPKLCFKVLPGDQQSLTDDASPSGAWYPAAGLKFPV